MENQLARLRTMAAAHHVALVSKDALLVEMGRAIARRMVKRTGAHIYQMLTCSLPYFPRDLLREMIPQTCLKEDTTKVMHWELTTVTEVEQVLGPVLQKSGYVCMGSTKAFRSRSERVIRVAAKLMCPFEITHQVSGFGAERCYLNGMYMLVTQDGEMHFPKDNQRRELAIPIEERLALRNGVNAEMSEIGQQGHPLSPTWWRQLGNEVKATEAEQLLASSAPARRLRKGQKAAPLHRRVSQESFEIGSIVGEKRSSGKVKIMYLVQWAGYDASWEPWRISGQVGDPIETWEPAQRLRGTAALEVWRTTTRP